MGAPPSSLETWSSLSLSLGHLGQEEADTSTALMTGFSAERFQGVEAALPCWAPFGLGARVNGPSVCLGYCWARPSLWVLRIADRMPRKV